MKKLLIYLTAMLATVAIAAQDLPQYSFFSNWQAGIGINYSKQGNGHGFVFREGASVGADLVLDRQMIPELDARVRLGLVGALTDFDKSVAERYARYGTFTLGIRLNLLNGIFGYNSNRHNEVYLFGDAGLAFWNNYLEAGNTDIHKLNFIGDGGIGYEHHFTNSSVFVEARINDVSHLPNIFKKHHYGLDALVAVGYKHSLGLTKTDRELVEQYRMLTQERFDSLETLCNNRKDTISMQRREISYLDRECIYQQEKLFELEQTIDSLRKHGSNKELDSLIQLINEKQLEEFALPFSVLFDIDSYTIRADQKIKIDAVADIMKQEGVKYRVCGFADYTGSDEYNIKLSEKRANAVKEALVKCGVDESLLSVERYGKNRPFANEKYSLNRKVSFYRVIK